MLKMTEKQKQIVEMLMTGATHDAIPATEDEIQEAEDRYFGIDNRPEFDLNVQEWMDYILNNRPTCH